MIDQYIRNNARRFAERVTVSIAGHGLTFGELDDHVDRMCVHLAAAGAARGSRIAIVAGNSVEHIQVLLAVLRMGAIAVPINTRLAPAEVAYLLDDVTPALLVTDPAHEPLAAQALAVARAGVDTIVARPPWEAPLPEAGRSGGGSWINGTPADPRDPAFILYTSGTTGRPNGAVLDHLGVFVNSLAVLGRLGMHDASECRHLGVPLFHSGGINSVLQQLILGGPLVLSSGPFDPAATLDLLEQFEVATAFFTPTQWQQICGVPGVGGRKLSLKRIVWGTSSTPRHVLTLLHSTFAGVPVYAQFGQTETCGTTCTLGPEFADSKLGSVGKPLPHIQMRIVDPAMRDVPRGEVGEIVYRGPSVMVGYWNNPTATADAFAGGWFHSGDLATVDDDGFVSVVGRLKEMIISGGENIYPLEVEAAIVTHPKVRDVAVVGLPHSRWVESPAAVIVPADPADPPTLAEIHEYLRTRLASYKKPTALFTVDALPRNAMGKVVKAAVRDGLANAGGRNR